MADAVIAEERDNAVERAKYPTDPNDPAILEKPMEESSAPPTFQASTDIRRVNLVEGDSSKQIFVGTNLSPK
jgi:hypothetical protein